MLTDLNVAQNESHINGEEFFVKLFNALKKKHNVIKRKCWQQFLRMSLNKLCCFKQAAIGYLITIFILWKTSYY